MQDAESKILKEAKWLIKNIINDEINQNADLVLCDYVLNEINFENREKVLEKLYNSTNKILVIIEPGTPEGFAEIKSIREYFIKRKANIIAPCTHMKKCNVKEGDWCAFSVRVARTKIHKILKDGSAPYEDEKFSYIAFSKVPVNNSGERILRHPQINSGYVNVKVCSTNGIEEKTYSKKDKEIYKKVRKMDAGQKLC